MREKGHTTIRNHSTISSISNGREVNLREYGERGVGHRKSGLRISLFSMLSIYITSTGTRGMLMASPRVPRMLYNEVNHLGSSRVCLINNCVDDPLV